MKRPFYNAFHSLLYDRRQFIAAIIIRLGFLFPNKLYLRLQYRLDLRKRLDLNNPISFNEKLQWLKLYYHHPKFTDMADKIKAKQIVAESIGEKYVVPILGEWDDPKTIDWERLPEKFVLKTNHDGGNYGVVICSDRNKFNKEKAIKRLKRSLRRNTYLLGREWPYKDIKRKVFAEQYIEDEKTNDLPDYKFFCFNGVVRLVYVATERQSSSGVKFDYYDENFNHLELWQSHPNASTPPSKPKNFNLMKELAEKLSVGLPHVRVDFFEANGEVLFSEFTFYSLGGWAAFHPEEWDFKLGNYLQLPNKKII